MTESLEERFRLQYFSRFRNVLAINWAFHNDGYVSGDCYVRAIISETYFAENNNPLYTEPMTLAEARVFISEKKQNKDYKLCITGKNIKRYIIEKYNGYVDYNPKKLMRPRNQEIFESQEKLIMQMININLVVAYDDNQLYNLGTTYAITKRSDKINLKFLLTLFSA